MQTTSCYALATMRRAFRFILVLIVGLALVTWVTSLLVDRTTRGWFERDVTLRAQLAVRGARPALASQWRTDRGVALRDLLEELTRDERIMAAAACSTDLVLLARTVDFPEQVACERLGPRLWEQERAVGPGAAFAEVVSLPGGDVHVSAIPIGTGAERSGFAVVVHDLSFVERRAAQTRRFLVLAFGFLAVAASAITLIATRLFWRGWLRDLRTDLRSGTRRPEFQPLMRDVRDVVDRIVAERELDREGGAWTPQRLKLTLTQYLHGERIVVLANRQPYIHQRSADGDTVSVLHPASGLVTALEPVMRACSGTWIAHGSGTADRETVDRHDRVRVPPEEESYVLRRVWLSDDEEKGYYYGFSNEGLWPLCHIAHTRPVFRNDDWIHYQTVNERFADAVVDEVETEDPIVLVQDYHLGLAPRLIRERLPRSTVITFWHVPWPNSQRFGICPWSKELLDGMLGASIVGFHTQSDCNNFVESVDRYLEARIDRENHAVVQHGHTTLVRAYPISLEWPPRWLKGAPSIEDCRRNLVAELGLPANALIGLGVDRLDYTKGIEERLLAVERLLERCPEYRGRFTFVQLAAPSRTVIERYRQLNEDVDRLAVRINDRFGDGAYQPIVLLRSHHEPPRVFRYYRAADLCYVSSLHDGMNLVAKEFVAARDDEDGVLVLSQFTGAARELTEALIVNPYDLEEASSALGAALQMSRDERRDRMRAMRFFVSEFNVYRWAGRMLVDAARLRSRDRLTGRLTDHLGVAAASGVSS